MKTKLSLITVVSLLVFGLMMTPVLAEEVTKCKVPKGTVGVYFYEGAPLMGKFVIAKTFEINVLEVSDVESTNPDTGKVTKFKKYRFDADYDKPSLVCSGEHGSHEWDEIKDGIPMPYHSYFYVSSLGGDVVCK